MAEIHFESGRLEFDGLFVSPSQTFLIIGNQRVSIRMSHFLVKGW